MSDQTKKVKEYSIIVNSRDKIWNKKKISYEEVVVLAFETYIDNGDMIYTITFSKGNNSNQEGSLVKDGITKVKDGMIFNVTQTNKS